MSEFKVSDDADSSILLVLWHIVLNGHILQDFQSAAGLNGTDSSKISVSMFSSNSKKFRIASRVILLHFLIQLGKIMHFFDIQLTS